MHNASKDKIGELKKRVEEQCRALGSLASSLEDEDKLGELMKRVEKPFEAFSSLAAGVVGEGSLLRTETRQIFLNNIDFKQLFSHFCFNNFSC
jgi:hypothetical protein